MILGPEINVEIYLNSALLRPPVAPSAEIPAVGTAVVPQKGWGSAVVPVVGTAVGSVGDHRKSLLRMRYH